MRHIVQPFDDPTIILIDWDVLCICIGTDCWTSMDINVVSEFLKDKHFVHVEFFLWVVSKRLCELLYLYVCSSEYLQYIPCYRAEAFFERRWDGFSYVDSQDVEGQNIFF